MGETFLDQEIPPEIRSLYPTGFPLTHFWVEIELEDEWRILDASFNPPLSKGGLIVNNWESNKTCFAITKVLTQDETIAYQAEGDRPDYANATLKQLPLVQ